MKDEFVSVVSHELRTPLTSIKEGVSLVLDGALGKTNAVQEEFLQTVSRNIDRLAELINNLLDLSKMEAGKVSLIRRGVELVDLIELTCQSYQAIVGGRKIVRDLRPVPAVFCDQNRVLQVLGNLFSNAVKFTPEGGTITIRTEEQDGFVAVSVTDTGPGIPKEDLDKLFQKFEQLGRSSSERPRGTGRGLAISKQIVELHHGKISAESKEGRGTAFTFTLPIYYPSQALEELFDETMAAAKGEEEEFGLVLIDLGGVKAHLGRVAGITPAPTLFDFEEMVRKNIHRGDRMLMLDETYLVIMAVSNRKGVRAMRERLEGVCEGWIEQCYGRGSQASIAFGSSVYPHDGKTVTALMQKAKAGIEEAGSSLKKRRSAEMSAKKKILLAEDDVAIVKMTKRRLEHEGYEVVTALDGEEALERATTDGAVDLILLDIKMPKLSGYDICKRLKANRKTAGIPIIIFTATEAYLKRIADLCIELGTQDWIRKPFDSKELLEKIRKVLGEDDFRNGRMRKEA